MTTSSAAVCGDPNEDVDRDPRSAMVQRDRLRSSKTVARRIGRRELAVRYIPGS